MSDALTFRALLQRPLPEGTGARLDAAAATLGALLDEQHRLEQLGFELPLARCQQQVRYWGFVTGLLTIAASESAAQGEGSWPSDPR